MSDLVRLMQAHFQRLLSNYEVGFSAEQIPHSGERGRLLEKKLEDFLGEVLPKRVGIGSGQIVEALEKEPSKQLDIILYDAFNYPLLINEGSYLQIPNEAALVTIEVKSRLNRKYLIEGVGNIASSKGLKKFPKDKYSETLGILFCFETLWKRPITVFRNLYEIVENNQGYAPDLICSLKPGFLLAASNTLGGAVSRLNTLIAGMEPLNEYPPDKFIFIRPQKFSQEHILLWFYLLLIDYVNHNLGIGVNMAQYIKTSTAWRTDIIDLSDGAM